MANVLYPAGKSALLQGAIAWETDSLFLSVLDDSYVYDPAHTSSGDVTTASLWDEALTGCTVLDGGVADADNLNMAIGSGETVASMVIYDASAGGVLLAFYDENADTTPILRVTDGDPVIVTWSASPQRCFQI